MTVIRVDKDLEARTLTLTARYAAPVERVWDLWRDPRKLERWWGPPTYPATFEAHDLSPGGLVTYFMTGPGGDKHRGWWRVLSVEAPRRLSVEDGFADAEGNPLAEMPTTRMHVSIDATAEGGAEMVIRSEFPTLEALERLLAMGMLEGLKAAVGQIDALLA